MTTEPLTEAEPVGAIVYGPPRSRWGRLRNRIRRLVGIDEQDEVIAWMTPSEDDRAVRLSWNARGILTIEDDDD